MNFKFLVMPEEIKDSSSDPKDEDRRNVRGPSFRKLEKMNYLEILDNYIEYPSKNLKFAVTNLENKRDRVKFLSEEDKAYGWIQNHSTCRKTSKFLQTNLHYLPEHLWSKLVEFKDSTVDSVVGYKVTDNNINYFVHKADSDSISRELYKRIKMDKLSKTGGVISDEEKEEITKLNSYLVEKGIDSWVTIRASKLLQGPDQWVKSTVFNITKDYLLTDVYCRG